MLSDIIERSPRDLCYVRRGEHASDSPAYHLRVDQLARWLRAVGYVLLAAGLVRLGIAIVTGEGVDQSGMVPAITAGYVLIAVSAYALMSGSFARNRRLGWLTVPAALAILVVASMWTISTGDGHLVDYARGARGSLGLVAFFGYFVTAFTLFIMLGLIPLTYLLAWLADRIPTLRSRGVRAHIRRAGRPRF